MKFIGILTKILHFVNAKKLLLMDVNIMSALTATREIIKSLKNKNDQGNWKRQVHLIHHKLRQRPHRNALSNKKDGR